MNGDKTNLKQFFTHGYEVLRPFLNAYPMDADWAVDPFAGAGHLLKLVSDFKTFAVDVDADVSPDLVCNSFDSIPKLRSCFVITNPPYSHRHVLQRQDVDSYEMVVAAGYTDLYEYAVRRVIDQLGFPPIFAVVPENFIASRTTVLRGELCGHIKAVQIHTRSTCEDTSQPTVMVHLVPESIEHADLWVDGLFKATVTIGPDGFRPNLPASPNRVDFGMKSGQLDSHLDTGILLQATDGGSDRNRIKLMRVCERFAGEKRFRSKPSDRAYIQVVPHFRMDEAQIAALIREFNEWVDDWRDSTHGLGLTSFRSNTGGGFRRKRLDFKLARNVINWIIDNRLQLGS